MPTNDRLTDLKHRAYGLILRHGTAALARAWRCPTTVIYQIVNDSVGSNWLHHAALRRVKALGAHELARRTGVPARQISVALASGNVPDALAQYVTTHTEPETGWSYPDTPTNEGLN
jgi:hypothetical protein